MPGIRGPGRRRPCWPRPRPGPPVTGAHLASYAGLAPVTRRSGSSIRGEHVSHGGNKRLKRAMFPSAFASLRSDPVSRAYYQRKPGQGKRLGPSRPRPGPPPHPDPARHDPKWSPLRPTTSHETTRSRLTHHIGAPPQSEKHHAPQLKHRKSATPNYPHSRTASSRIEFASYIISDMKTNCRRKPYFPRTGVCYKPKCRHMCDTFPSPNRKMNNTKQHRVQ